MRRRNRSTRAGKPGKVAYQLLAIGGERSAVVREDVLRRLCAKAGLEMELVRTSPPLSGNGDESEPYDGKILAERIAQRRKAAGLTQAALADRAGIRIETLNRIERGRTTPDFSTIRKLVTAIQKAETVAGR